MFQKWPWAMQRKGHGPIVYGKRSWGGQSNMSSEHRNLLAYGSFVLFGVCLFTDFLATYSTAPPELLVF
ncbi:putative DASH complex subunit [Clavispora lusitaniae]|uniref:DASH complex subunit n=1 Tax=Clavispora lusitaniae TaxID=36911 RepID=A0ACD0WE45_CLALS|nr:putative DASH complex subunit [Clavispora lusitaniae]QFZ31159.1 putative DASH complex subunit [Clavispora lusitaniae]QFZ36827.1 putative DASH complex subunit [Clavispora lusitaniae]QFZ42511.1 putative DASH complex subunit [Clavispora lusitaniae]QFZ48187.1 putative DASH complex subunit [Clavispora lusitaniae]